MKSKTIKIYSRNRVDFYNVDLVSCISYVKDKKLLRIYFNNTIAEYDNISEEEGINILDIYDKCLNKQSLLMITKKLICDFKKAITVSKRELMSYMHNHTIKDEVKK